MASHQRPGRRGEKRLCTCSLIRLEPTVTYLILKSMPMVVMNVWLKESFAKRRSSWVFCETANVPGSRRSK